VAKPACFGDLEGENVALNLNRLIREVESEDRIRIYLDSEINQVEGSMGRFKTIITSGGKKVQCFTARPSLLREAQNINPTSIYTASIIGS